MHQAAARVRPICKCSAFPGYVLQRKWGKGLLARVGDLGSRDGPTRTTGQSARTQHAAMMIRRLLVRQFSVAGTLPPIRVNCRLGLRYGCPAQELGRSRFRDHHRRSSPQGIPRSQSSCTERSHHQPCGCTGKIAWRYFPESRRGGTEVVPRAIGRDQRAGKGQAALLLAGDRWRLDALHWKRHSTRLRPVRHGPRP